MPRFFTPDYVERAMLRDGTIVLLRLVGPEDKTLLRREFERWSPESRYARFLAPKQQLTDDELDYLCNLDQENHFAIGAIAEAGEGDGDPVGLGIARFIRLPTQPLEPVTAEAAIAVADEAQGKGLGRLLFACLAAAAAERGIERFRCEVLCSNTS
ncbi:MAG TPA: GNAT family N-acetyltransferase, partial [Kofleriaceae bacterium]